MKNDNPKMKTESGKVSQLRFVARNWEKPNSHFEKHGISKRNIRRLKQNIKHKYPEILELYNPPSARKLLA